MTQADRKTRIREFLETFVGDAEFSNQDNIFELGLVNSLMAMQLVLFLEKEFSLRFGNDELNLSNFSSIEAIDRLVESKENAA